MNIQTLKDDISFDIVKLRRIVGTGLNSLVGAFAAKRFQTTSVPVIAPHPTINIVSYIGRRTGIASGAVLQAEAFKRLGYQVRLIDATQSIRNPFTRSLECVANSVVIIHASSMQILPILNYLKGSSQNCYRIGYCASEVDLDDWRGFDSQLHEVWVPSLFSANLMKPIAQRPVHIVRHVVFPPGNTEARDFRSRLQIPVSSFVVLAMADLRSSFARKNPQGAVAAFIKAFGNRTDVVLILKLNASDFDTKALSKLKDQCVGYNIVFLHDYLTRDDLWALYRSCDVFLSLHRSEGFGLPILEAMCVGLPVIATNWSGNCEFMTKDTAALVEFQLVPVKDPQRIYKTGEWAEPNVELASLLLSELRDDEDLRSRIVQNAKAQSVIHKQISLFEAQIKRTVLGTLTEPVTPVAEPVGIGD